MASEIGDTFAYVGSYTVENAVRDRFVTNAKGIEVFRVRGKDGVWEHVQTVEQLNPMYLLLCWERKVLYAASSDSNLVYAYRVDGETGALSLLNCQAVDGKSTLCLGLSGDGQYLVVGSISGHVACVRVEPDGSLGIVCDDFALPGKAGPLRDAQPWPRAHHSVFDPEGRYCYIVDKGKDTVDTYYVDPKSGKMTCVSSLQGRGGSCLRHIVFHPSGRFAYVNSEYIGTVLTCLWTPETGKLETIQILPTIPEDYVENYSLSSELELHPNGRFLYVSNRGHDSIAIFEVDPESGRLTTLGWQKVGNIPRYFVIEPGGRYLYVCNQGTGEICSFAINPETGMLKPVGEKIQTPTPVWLEFSGPIHARLAERKAGESWQGAKG